MLSKLPQMSGTSVDHRRFRQASPASARDVLREIDERHEQRLQEIEERRRQRNVQPSAPSIENNEQISDSQSSVGSFWPAPRINIPSGQPSIFNASEFPPLRSNRHDARFHLYNVSQISEPQPLQHQLSSSSNNIAPTVPRQSDLEIIGHSSNARPRVEQNSAEAFSQAQTTRQQREPSSRFPAVNEILQGIDERHRQRTALLNPLPLAPPQIVSDNRENDSGFSSAVTSQAPRTTSNYPAVREILQTIDERQNQRVISASRFGQHVRPSAPSCNELLDLPPSFISVTQTGCADVPSRSRFMQQVIDDLPPSYEEAVRNMT